LATDRVPALLSSILALGLVGFQAATARAQNAETRWAPLLEHDGVAVVVNRRALPRAWLVSEVLSVSAADALRMIRGEAEELDPARSALLEVPERELPVVGAAAFPTDSAAVKRSADGEIAIDTNARASSFLVVSESYFPGWRALVDGSPAKVYQTDYILMGVAVPAGTHHVELRYTAPGATFGAMMSLATIGGMLGLAVYARRRQRS
jgi:hypothetical protein